MVRRRTVGAAVVANAEPDGYTLLASAPSPLVTAAALYKNLGYEPSSSFAPIALLFTSPQLLAVNSALPGANLFKNSSLCALQAGFPRIGLVNGRQLVDLLVERWGEIPQEFRDRLGLRPGVSAGIGRQAIRELKSQQRERSRRRLLRIEPSSLAFSRLGRTAFTT